MSADWPPEIPAEDRAEVIKWGWRFVQARQRLTPEAIAEAEAVVAEMVATERAQANLAEAVRLLRAAQKEYPTGDEIEMPPEWNGEMADYHGVLSDLIDAFLARLDARL